MKTEHALARALKEMMASQPLDTISVIDLSNKCDVSRKTFYYHYHDIYDLLTQVFLDEKMLANPNINSLDELVELVWKYYKENEMFVNATLSSAGKDLFVEYIYNSFYTTCMKIVLHNDEHKVLHLNTRKHIARFYASGYSNSIVYYLSNYKNKSLEGLKQCFMFLNNQNIEKSVQKAIKMSENAKKL